MRSFVLDDGDAVVSLLLFPIFFNEQLFVYLALNPEYILEVYLQTPVVSLENFLFAYVVVCFTFFFFCLDWSDLWIICAELNLSCVINGITFPLIKLCSTQLREKKNSYLSES